MAIPFLLASLGHRNMQLKRDALSALICLAASPALRPPVLSALINACTASASAGGSRSDALDQETRLLILSELSSTVLPACSSGSTAVDQATSAAAQRAALKLMHTDAGVRLINHGTHMQDSGNHHLCCAQCGDHIILSQLLLHFYRPSRL